MTIPGKTRWRRGTGMARIERAACYSVSAPYRRPLTVRQTGRGRTPRRGLEAAFPHMTAAVSPNQTPLRHASLFRSGLGFRLALAAGLVLPLWLAILWATA